MMLSSLYSNRYVRVTIGYASAALVLRRLTEVHEASPAGKAAEAPADTAADVEASDGATKLPCWILN